jgi:hypothetical protein
MRFVFRIFVYVHDLFPADTMTTSFICKSNPFPLLSICYQVIVASNQKKHTTIARREGCPIAHGCRDEKHTAINNTKIN